MFTTVEDMKFFLELNIGDKMKPIFYREGDEKIFLVYKDEKLWRPSPYGGMAYKPLTDVKQLDFNYDLDAWVVTWKN